MGNNNVLSSTKKNIDHENKDGQRAKNWYPYNPTETDIDIREDPQSVFQYVREYKQGRIKLDPEYQRNLVWNKEKKSRFIESIILNFPLPPIYVHEQIDGSYVIIDGLQRTHTLDVFLKNELQLVGLKALKQFNDKYFKDLPKSIQAKIERKKINFYILKPSVPFEVIYELFDRINTGGTLLNRQEVRNGIFTGKSTRLLKKLSEKDYFRTAIDNGLSPKRMKDREVILRYLSFKLFGYQAYEGDLSGFLEKALKHINKMDDSKIEQLEQDFKRVMELSFSFFGNKNFRIPTSTKKRGSINTSVLESVSYFFSLQTDEFLAKNKDNIINNFSKLLENSDYLAAVKQSIGSKSQVKKRFTLAQEILGKVDNTTTSC